MLRSGLPLKSAGGTNPLLHRNFPWSLRCMGKLRVLLRNHPKGRWKYPRRSCHDPARLLRIVKGADAGKTLHIKTLWKTFRARDATQNIASYCKVFVCWASFYSIWKKSAEAILTMNYIPILLLLVVVCCITTPKKENISSLFEGLVHITFKLYCILMGYD